MFTCIVEFCGAFIENNASLFVNVHVYFSLHNGCIRLFFCIFYIYNMLRVKGYELGFLENKVKHGSSKNAR